MNIVVVEDEIRIREGICKLVEKISENYHVVATADNGLDGYNKIKEYKPDIVITDIMMAGMSGMEMLSKLKEEGIVTGAIVISAYSEFSYAQTAMHLGVKEYLVKPVTIQELKKALFNVEKDMKEYGYVSEALGSLNNVLLGVINGIVETNDELDAYLLNKYNIKKDSGFMEMTIYLGYYYEENVLKVRKTIEKILSECSGKSIVLEIPGDMSLLAIIYDYDTEEQIERIIQEKIRQHSVSLHRVCMGIIKAESVRDIKSSYRLINSFLDWNMIFGDDVLIMYPKITNIFAERNVYPSDIENKMKAAVYEKQKKNVIDTVKKFEEYYFSGKLYTPKDVKEAYCRFIWAALDTCKDINENTSEELTQKQLIERIERSKSSREMKDILEMIFDEILKEKSDGDTIGLTVKKTIKMIHDFYKDGITLDEIAGKLNITPEYLSAQFQKEVGLNFSTYIRNYRIGKAKQLLISSNMKVYEVAEEVGYQDSKYFSRVFRQVTGQKPDEYRKNKR